jgi:hypothetical protein
MNMNTTWLLLLWLDGRHTFAVCVFVCVLILLRAVAASVARFPFHLFTFFHFIFWKTLRPWGFLFVHFFFSFPSLIFSVGSVVCSAVVWLVVSCYYYIQTLYRWLSRKMLQTCVIGSLLSFRKQKSFQLPPLEKKRIWSFNPDSGFPSFFCHFHL